MSVSYSISRAGLEIYTTAAVKKPVTNTGDSSSGNNFVLGTGDITNIEYLGELYGDSFESDYSDISSNATVSIPIKYLGYFYKGRRVALKKGGQTKKNVSNWSDLSTVVDGFVTEITWTRDKAEIKIKGMDILLDKEAKFTFKKTKRSKIVKKIIKASGLKAKVNVKGLKDDVTDFTNVSDSGKSNSSASSSATGGEGETIDSLVKKIIGDETNELKKAKLVHGWLKDNVRYGRYSCSKYHSAEECLKHKGSLNCADTARLTRAMMSSAGLDAWVVHRSHANGHFWTLIKIGGKIYASDQTGSGSPWNTIWYADGDRRSCDSRGGNWDSKNGKNPDC